MPEPLPTGYVLHDGETVIVERHNPDGTTVVTWPGSLAEHTVPTSSLEPLD